MKHLKTSLKVSVLAILCLTTLAACEEKSEYRTYENGRLPYILEVPATWEMDESNPVLIKFLNAEHTIVISCEIGDHSLIPEKHFNDFYEYLYKEHEDSLFNKETHQKTDSLYILKWKGKNDLYVFDGSKCMNGYLCGIQVNSTPEATQEAQTIFQHVFESLRPNPNFIAPASIDDEEFDED